MMGVAKAGLPILLTVALVGGAVGCPEGDANSNGNGTSGAPYIRFDFVPQQGTIDDLRGLAGNVPHDDYGVAVFIYVGGRWWTKPTFAEPLTPIETDGTWTTDITTGGIDEQASRIATFLVPRDCMLPMASGESHLPAGIFDCSVAHVALERSDQGTTRLVFFSGYEWWTKSSTEPVGPGPNIFSDDEENVWVDEQGHLHLKITKRNGQYRCAEIVSRDSFGYGEYTFVLDSRADHFNENVVLGLFTWSDDPAYHYREMDIEFSRWGDPSADNAQFVVQPWDTPGNRERYRIRPGDVPSAHGLHWQSDSITFSSAYGRDAFPEDPNLLIHSWTYSGTDVPAPGDENVRMNLWLMWGNPPTDGQDIEVVIGSFEFVQN